MHQLCQSIFQLIPRQHIFVCTHNHGVLGSCDVITDKQLFIKLFTRTQAAEFDGDITIEFSGLRPGEKLYEELLIGDNVAATQHPMIMRANEDMLSWDELKDRLTQLMHAVHQDDYVQVRQILCNTVSGYSPEGEIVDWVYQQSRS